MGEAELPACRARLTQALYAHRTSLAPEHAARVETLLGADHRTLLESSSPVAYLSADVHFGCLRALRTTLGLADYRSYCDTVITATLDHPLLFGKPVRAAMALVGTSPFALLKLTPMSLKFVFRALGEMHVEVASNDLDATARWENLPAPYAADDVWDGVWRGSFEAVMRRACEARRTTYEVRSAKRDATAGRFEWTVHIHNRG